MSAEIVPNWKNFGVIALIAVSLFLAIVSGRYMFQVGKALAAESLYHQIDREWPRGGSLVYVPFGLDNCLHLARFDSETKLFYDDQGWLAANKWLYVTDRWPPEAKTCTTEDR